MLSVIDNNMNISTLRLCFTRVVTLCVAALFTALLPAVAAPPGKTQQLTSPDQVPDGVAKSD